MLILYIIYMDVVINPETDPVFLCEKTFRCVLSILHPQTLTDEVVVNRLFLDAVSVLTAVLLPGK